MEFRKVTPYAIDQLTESNDHFESLEFDSQLLGMVFE